MDEDFDDLRKPGINYVTGSGQYFQPVIMFIGEAPGPMENAKGTPFIGGAGTIFRNLLRNSNLDEVPFYVTNVMKYMPCKPNTMDFRKPTNEEIQLAQPYLAKEIRCVDPRIICLMGNVPIRAFFKGESSVTKLHGKFFNVNPEVFISYHPSLVQYKPLALHTLQRDFNKLASRVHQL